MNNRLNISRQSPPKQSRSIERKRLIMVTALDLINERGVANVTTNDIAAQANIPIGSIYRYFTSKEDLLGHLLELYANEKAQLVNDVIDNPLLSMLSWYDILNLLTYSWYSHARINKPYLLLNYLRSVPGLMSQLRPHPRSQVLDMFRELLDARLANSLSQNRPTGIDSQLYTRQLTLIVEHACSLDDALAPKALETGTHMMAAYFDIVYPLS